MAAANPGTSPGSTRRPQPSRISGIMDTRVETTGRPRAMASKILAGTWPTVSEVARSGGARLPRVGVPYMRDQRAPEALPEEARGYRASVGERSETLAEPGPRQAIRVAEVERAPDRAPEARPNIEAQLPVVDVEEEG